SSCSLCLGVTGTSQYGSGAKAQRTWGRVDLLNGKATIVLSRTLGEENAPKTGAITRTIALLPNVVELLKTLLPLHVTAEDYVFTDEQGRPIDQNEFGRKFQDVLRVLNIRPRPFYNTRHTYISVALTLGCNPKWIAEQTGTSIAMIQQNYGRYIRGRWRCTVTGLR